MEMLLPLLPLEEFLWQVLLELELELVLLAGVEAASSPRPCTFDPESFHPLLNMHCLEMIVLEMLVLPLLLVELAWQVLFVFAVVAAASWPRPCTLDPESFHPLLGMRYLLENNLNTWIAVVADYYYLPTPAKTARTAVAVDYYLPTPVKTTMPMIAPLDEKV